MSVYEIAPGGKTPREFYLSLMSEGKESTSQGLCSINTCATNLELFGKSELIMDSAHSCLRKMECCSYSGSIIAARVERLLDGNGYLAQNYVRVDRWRF